jgi:hypothetical protein
MWLISPQSGEMFTGDADLVSSLRVEQNSMHVVQPDINQTTRFYNIAKAQAPLILDCIKITIEAKPPNL